MKTILMGLGLSGLSYYDTLKKKSNVIAIDKCNELGGYTRTIKIDRFSFDYTGHFLHLSNFEHPSEIGTKGQQYANLWQQVLKKSSVYIDGKTCDAPYQYNFGALGHNHAEEAIRSFGERPRNKDTKTLSDYFLANFGEFMCRSFFWPYNTKLLGSNLNELSQLQISRFFPKIDNERIFSQLNKASKDSNEILPTYNAKFWYPVAGGIEQLLNHFRKPANPICSKLNSIDIKERTIRLDNGHEYTYDNLVSSIPLYELLKAVNPSIVNQELINQLTASSTLVVHVGLKQQLQYFEDKAWVYVPSEDTNVYRVGNYSFASPTMHSANEGAALYVELSDKSINPVKESTEYLRNHFGLLEENIETLTYSTLNPAYVHFKVGLTKQIEDTLAELESYGIYSIGRYGRWGYVSMEDCIIQAKELAHKWN
jgi:protoporphyrinogen oxidase